MNIKIIQGDCTRSLLNLDNKSIDTIITSPPYYALRNYNDEEEQVGLEATPELYIQKLVSIFRIARTKLKDDGTVWLNLGDSYAGSNGNGYKQTISKYNRSNNAKESVSFRDKYKRQDIGYKPKDLMLIPFRVAYALQQDGWYLRQDIIWNKPNPMPESVKDRCTKAHEYIFLLSKSQRYYFDSEAIKEEAVTQGQKKLSPSGWDISKKGSHGSFHKEGRSKEHYEFEQNEKRNKRSVWTVTPKSFKGAHFATFPEDLIDPCVLAGSKEGGTVLDIFAGSGTTGIVANNHNRNAILLELNKEYIEIAEKRILDQGSLFTDLEIIYEENENKRRIS